MCSPAQYLNQSYFSLVHSPNCTPVVTLPQSPDQRSLKSQEVGSGKSRQENAVKMSLTNRDLFDKARPLKFEMDPSLLNLILEKKKIQLQDDVDSVSLDLFLENFLRLAKKKWKDASSHVHRMETKFGDWLDQEASVPDLNPKTTPQKSTPKSTPRKTKDFVDLCDRSKRRETADLRASNGCAKLLHAATSSLMTSGNPDAAHVLAEVQKSPERATKIRRLSAIATSMEKPPTKDVCLPKKISNEDTLAHLFNADLTKEAYKSTRLMSKSHFANIWPAYNVSAAKILCRPNGISYGEKPPSLFLLRNVSSITTKGFSSFTKTNSKNNSKMYLMAEFSK